MTDLYDKNHDILLVRDFVCHKSARTTELYIEQNKDKVFGKVAELIDMNIKRQKT